MGEWYVMIFTNGNMFTISDTNLILGEEFRGIINPFDSIKNTAMYLWRANNEILFL